MTEKSRRLAPFRRAGLKDQHYMEECREKNAEKILAAGYGADYQEGFFACDDIGGERGVPGFVGEVFGAGEEAEEWAALQGIVVADGAAEHGIAGFQFIQDRAKSWWNGEF